MGPRGDAAVRILRIFRVLRVMKLMKYVPYVGLMSASAGASAAPIAMALFVMGIGTVLLAFGAYYTERGEWDAALGLYTTEGRPSPFQSILEATYWAVITLTGVGYGDIVPITLWGKIVGGITAIAGTIIVAFPVSIYTEEFGKEYSEMVKTLALQAEMGASATPAAVAAAAARAVGVFPADRKSVV